VTNHPEWDGDETLVTKGSVRTWASIVVTAAFTSGVASVPVLAWVTIWSLSPL
jgi:hypothetical protein